jgi:hypothetical protein
MTPPPGDLKAWQQIESHDISSLPVVLAKAGIQGDKAAAPALAPAFAGATKNLGNIVVTSGQAR